MANETTKEKQTEETGQKQKMRLLNWRTENAAC